MAAIFIVGLVAGILLDNVGTLLFAVSNRFWYIPGVSRPSSELAGNVNKLADNMEFLFNSLLMPMLAFALLLMLWQRTKQH